MKRLTHNQIVWILVLFVAVAMMLCSCTAGKKMHKSGIYIAPYARSADTIKVNVLYPMAEYDSCKSFKRKHLQGYCTLIYLQNSSCVIEGKKCEFKKGEMLYYKVVKWHQPDFNGSYFKYIISNKDESIKYPKFQ